MGTFKETLEYLELLTNDIKYKALSRVNNLNEIDKDKINIVADKTIELFEEAGQKVKEAAEIIKNDDELNLFLRAVEEKCLQNRDFAIEKFDEIIAENTPKEKIIYTNNDTIEYIVERLLDIAKEQNTCEIIKKEVPVSNDSDIIDDIIKPVKEEDILDEIIEPIKEESIIDEIIEPIKNEEHDLIDDIVEPIVDEVVSEEINDIPAVEVEEKVNEVIQEVKQQETNKTTLDTLLEDESFKYAADFLTSIKNNVTEFLNKPETKATMKEIKLNTLIVVSKGLDALVKTLDAEEKEEK